LWKSLSIFDNKPEYNETQNNPSDSIIHLCIAITHAQVPPRIQKIFPEGTVFYQNIPYTNDTLRKHQLDIYLPAQIKSPLPLGEWVQGGNNSFFLTVE